jgi:hypothetical protein
MREQPVRSGYKMRKYQIALYARKTADYRVEGLPTYDLPASVFTRHTLGFSTSVLHQFGSPIHNDPIGGTEQDLDRRHLSFQTRFPCAGQRKFARLAGHERSGLRGVLTMD